MHGELKEQIGQISGCELRLSLNIFNDEVWHRENLAGLIEVIRLRHRHSGGMYELQEIEFVRCYLRVVFEIRSTMLAHNQFFRVATG